MTTTRRKRPTPADRRATLEAFGRALLREVHILAAAQAYVQARNDCPADQRIDVIAVSLALDGRVLSLDHIQGAVSV